VHPVVYMITDRQRLGERAGAALVRRVAAAARAGMHLIQIRERDMSDGELLTLVTQAVEAVVLLETGEAVDQTEQANEPVGDAGQPASAGSGPVLVSRQPIAMLASPSSSAPTLYGFPAGRPFRVIGHSGGFAQIKDLRSGASGWIDEAALAPPPGSPAVSAPSQSKPVAVNRQSAAPSAVPTSKPTKKDNQVTAGSEEASEPVQTPRRPGLFGGGGLFGGIFRNGN